MDLYTAAVFAALSAYAPLQQRPTDKVLVVRTYALHSRRQDILYSTKQSDPNPAKRKPNRWVSGGAGEDEMQQQQKAYRRQAR